MAAAEKVHTPVIQTGQVSQIVIGLMVVVGLIFAIAWMARNVLHIKPAVHGKFRILGGVNMGAREKVVLLEVGDTQLVLGVSPGRIQTLHVLDEPLPTEEKPTQEKLTFSRVLKHLNNNQGGGANAH